MHSSSIRRMTDFYTRYLASLDGAEQRTVLDLGSQDLNGSYKHIFDPVKWRYIGTDMAAGNNVDVVLADPYNWKEFSNESMDCVISGQSFEHIEFFWLTMTEIARVMKPGAICCILAPSGGPEHRYPQDCWRFYPDGMRALAKYVKLDCLLAETAWDEPIHPDLSHLWADTMLVAQKPVV